MAAIFWELIYTTLEISTMVSTEYFYHTYVMCISSATTEECIQRSTLLLWMLYKYLSQRIRYCIQCGTIFILMGMIDGSGWSTLIERMLIMLWEVVIIWSIQQLTIAKHYHRHHQPSTHPASWEYLQRVIESSSSLWVLLISSSARASDWG